MGAYILWVAIGASVLGGLVGTVIAALACRHRERPAMSAFGWFMIACAGWAFLAAARMSTTDLGTLYVLERLIRITSSSAGPLMLLFVVAYTGERDRLTPLTVGALWVVPVGYVALSLTPSLHGLASGLDAARIVSQHGATVGVVGGDVASTIEAVHTYGAILLAFGILFRFLLRSRAIYRRQAAMVGVGVLVPVAVDLGTKLLPATHSGVDLTPASLGVLGILLGWGLFRYDFLDVAPMASDILVSELPDPVFVLDDAGRILDHNRAADEVFPDTSLGGREIESVAPGLPETFTGNTIYSLSRGADGELTYFDPRVTEIDDQHGIERGRLIVLRDVTGQQRRQDRLEALQAATQQFITADSAQRIAELAVTFADRVLDQDTAAVYLFDEGDDTFHVTAASDAFVDQDSRCYATLDDPTHPMFDAYRTESVVVDQLSDRHPEMAFPHVMLVPIGGHGVLLIGSETSAEFVTEDEQFATILARTTQVALAQIDREQELRRSRRDVERRNEQVEFFNGVLRHTLRNALLVIEGRADHLRDHVDDARQRHLDRIVQWCEDLSELSEEIEAINDTVRASEARDLGTVALEPILQDRLSAVAEDFAEVTVEIDIESDLAVRSDDLVEKVIDSVLSNAIAHNDATEPHIEITARRIADRVQLRIADNGPGMTDEMKDTVFERGVRTSQTSHGFGLYFVSVMMNLYDGTVWIEDNDAEDGGAIAVLEFQQAESQHTSQSVQNELT